MASDEKTRYKAVIADHTYTVIGQGSKQHMDLVTKIASEQSTGIKHLSLRADTERASVPLAINTISDRLKRQEYALELEKQVADLKRKTIRLAELENRVRRMEVIREEARDVLKKNRQEDVGVYNRVEA